MVTWPRGEVVEVRRGGAGVLATLVADVATIGLDGSLQLRDGSDMHALLAVRRGVVVGALLGAPTHLRGSEALQDVRTLADSGGAVIEIHRMPPSLVEELLALHDGSRLDSGAGQEASWWRGRVSRPRRRRPNRLPSMAPTVRAPEEVQEAVGRTRSALSLVDVDLPPGCVRTVLDPDQTVVEAFMVAWVDVGGRSLVVRRESETTGEGIERFWLEEGTLSLPEGIRPGQPLLVVMEDVHLLPVYLGSTAAAAALDALSDDVRDAGGVLLIVVEDVLHDEEEAARLRRLAVPIEQEHLAAFAADARSLALLGAMDESQLMAQHERLSAWRAQPQSEEAMPTDAAVEVEVEAVPAPEMEAAVVEPVTVPEPTPAPSPLPEVPRPARRAQRVRSRRPAPRKARAPPRFATTKMPPRDVSFPASMARKRTITTDLVRNAGSLSDRLPEARLPSSLGLAEVRQLPDFGASPSRWGGDMRDLMRAAPMVEAIGQRQRMWREFRLRMPEHLPTVPSLIFDATAQKEAETVKDEPPSRPKRRRSSKPGSRSRRLGGDDDA